MCSARPSPLGVRKKAAGDPWRSPAATACCWVGARLKLKPTNQPRRLFRFRFELPDEAIEVLPVALRCQAGSSAAGKSKSTRATRSVLEGTERPTRSCSTQKLRQDFRQCGVGTTCEGAKRSYLQEKSDPSHEGRPRPIGQLVRRPTWMRAIARMPSVQAFPRSRSRNVGRGGLRLDGSSETKRERLHELTARGASRKRALEDLNLWPSDS